MSFKKEYRQLSTEGIVVEIVRKSEEWRVQVYGVYWFAKANRHLDFNPGDIVRVVGRRGNKLIIDKQKCESLYNIDDH
ncbi:NfeD family protein [Leptothoe sp. ISB3NOV94-8A]